MANQINPNPVPDGRHITRAQWNVPVRPSIKAEFAAIATERGEPLCHVAEEAFTQYLDSVRADDALVA